MSDASTLVHKTITLDDMWDACAAAALDIEVRQGARVLAGLQVERNPNEMRRAEVFTTLCMLIETMKEVESEFRALIVRQRGWKKREARK